MLQVSNHEDNSSIEDRLVMALLHMGQELLNSGAEILRVEDTLSRVGYAYGAVNMNVFVITSSIVITVEFPEQKVVTQTRRLRKISAGTDFVKLEQLNELSRQISLQQIPLDELNKKIDKIAEPKRNKWGMLVGYILGASGFAIFFGGSWADAIVAGLVGILIWIMWMHLSSICMNDVVYQFMASFISGLAICTIVQMVPGLNLDKIVIGDIMLLIPGVMFTNAIRDILLGDTLAGMLRFIEALLLTLALVLAFVAAIWLTKQVF